MNKLLNKINFFKNIYIVELISYFIVYRWKTFILSIPLAFLSNFILSLFINVSSNSFLFPSFSFLIFYNFYLFLFLFSNRIPKNIKYNLFNNFKNK